jgi:hypothetical protein
MGAMSMRGDALGVRTGKVGSLCGRRMVGCLLAFRGSKARRDGRFGEGAGSIAANSYGALVRYKSVM